MGTKENHENYYSTNKNILPVVAYLENNIKINGRSYVQRVHQSKYIYLRYLRTRVRVYL